MMSRMAHLGPLRSLVFVLAAAAAVSCVWGGVTHARSVPRAPSCPAEEEVVRLVAADLARALRGRPGEFMSWWSGAPMRRKLWVSFSPPRSSAVSVIACLSIGSPAALHDALRREGEVSVVVSSWRVAASPVFVAGLLGRSLGGEIAVGPLDEGASGSVPFVWRSPLAMYGGAECFARGRLAIDSGGIPGAVLQGVLLEGKRVSSLLEKYLIEEDAAGRLAAAWRELCSLLDAELRLSELRCTPHGRVMAKGCGLLRISRQRGEEEAHLRTRR